MIQFCPAYTLEMLDECDIDRLLPFYYACAFPEDDTPKTNDSVVYRYGKPFKRVNAKNAEWTKNIF